MKIKPFSKKQTLALTWWCSSSPYKNYDAVICDGAIRSGKTVCLIISFILWAFYRFNGSTFAICGKTIRSLRRNAVLPIIPILSSMGFVCRHKISENILEIKVKNRKNTFYLFGGKDESSASLIQGMTLSGILFDEVALMPQSFVDQALARCSVEKAKFWFNCNPEYPQHWFYKEWILMKKQKNAFYIHFAMDDNPSLSKETIARYKRLYTGSFYQRFIEGKWIAAEGLVYPYMCKDSAFIEKPCANFNQYAVSCDYGIVNPMSCGLWGELNGVWYRIDEYYFDSRTQHDTRTDEEHFNALQEMINNRPISCITVDPSATSFITLIRRKSNYPVRPAKNNVIDGIKEVSVALKKGDIKICINCKATIKEFSLYKWGTGMGKDAPVKENDHAMDDIRYFVTTVLTADDDNFFAMAAKR